MKIIEDNVNIIESLKKKNYFNGSVIMHDSQFLKTTK